MREIKEEIIIDKVCGSLISMSEDLPMEVIDRFKKAYQEEQDERSKHILEQLIENAEVAKTKHISLCQDTGIVVVFLKVGYDLHFNYDLYAAINKGVSIAYKEGFLRKSVVKDPLNRINTNDNTPAIIHTELVKGDKLEIEIMMKGAGSENMSSLKMFKPTASFKDIKDYVLDVVKEAGGKACPPLIIGLGIGGDFEEAPLLAKKAILRNLDEKESKEELEIKEEVNKLDIGPLGFGGKTTCLGVKIETYPCHIASLPVAVNLQCHAIRHRKVVI